MGRSSGLSLAAALGGGVPLTGCGEAAYLSYQGRPAQTALECKAAYEAAQDRGQQYASVGNSGASLVGAAIGRGIAEGAINSAYEQCLSHVANLPGETPLPDVAGVPQRVETVRTGSTVTKTFTYGTPPAAAPASPTTLYSGNASRPGQCRLQISGGTGYRCVSR